MPHVVFVKLVHNVLPFCQCYL